MSSYVTPAKANLRSSLYSPSTAPRTGFMESSLNSSASSGMRQS